MSSGASSNLPQIPTDAYTALSAETAVDVPLIKATWRYNGDCTVQADHCMSPTPNAAHKWLTCMRIPCAKSPGSSPLRDCGAAPTYTISS